MHKLTVLFFLLFLISCDSPNEIPDDVMSIGKMKSIIWDLLQAGGLSDIQYRKDSAIFVEKSTALYQKVFDIHGVTKEAFYKSYDYYRQHPDKNKLLMDSVTNYASQERAKLFKPAP